MKKLKEELKLIRWLLSDDYNKTLETVLKNDFRKDLLGVIKTAKTVFPFTNEGYFKDYEALKRDTINLWGVDVQEKELPDNLLGAYLPKGKNRKSVIFINKKKSPLFNLTTLSHETSHIPACIYFHKEHKPSQIPVRNRTTMFKKALTNKEEICADILTTFGAYPRPDFVLKFGKLKFGIRAVIKALFHLPQHYPELIRGFLRGKDIILNFALVIHFLKLRFFLYKQYNF